MYEISYGSKYESSKGLNRAEIAKLVRADIKAAVASGALPKAKYSVRVKSFSGGGSIDITFSFVEEPGFALFNAERLAFDIEHEHHVYSPDPIYSERAREMTKKLEAILGAYNYDGSDSQVDYFNVRFYGHATPQWEWERDVRKVEEAAVRASMVATEMAPAFEALLERVEAQNDAARVDGQTGFLSFLGVES